jgi:D-serine deaminase-like pyridoxal phosphate-dependent protein
MPGLRFCGVLSHAGHAYSAETPFALEAIALEETRLMTLVKTRLEQAGVDVREVSVGSTPTARFIGQQAGVTEMRPGNYVFFDRTQVGLGAATWETCAMSVLASVVSRPAANRLVFDAGSKTLTSDGVRGFTPAAGHGAVFRGGGAAPDLSIHVERLSEEHAVAKVPPDCDLRIGDRVRIVPNHACVVTNLADDLLFVRGDTIEGAMRVDARGKNR